MKNISKNRGFTLIELLVVIAIIGVLSAIIMVSLQGAKSKSRDAKRVSDIAQIQLALEQYFDRNGVYPNALGDLTSGSTVYISVIPTDPINDVTHLYRYYTDSNRFDYVLHANFENANAALTDALSNSPISGPICDKTSPHFDYCMGPK